MSSPTTVNPLDFATTADTGANAANTQNTQNTETPNPRKVYPNIAGSYLKGQLPAGLEANLLTIREFAAQVTVRNVQAGRTAYADIVQDQNVYTALKAKNSPLPVVLVYADEADFNEADEREAKVFLDFASAEKVWDERPKRGEGGASNPARSDDDLVEDAAKKVREFQKAQARLIVLAAKVKKLEAQTEKYSKLVANRGIAAETLDAKVEELKAAEDKSNAEDSTPDDNA